MKNDFHYISKDSLSDIIDQIDFSILAFGKVDSNNRFDLKGKAPLGYGLIIISNGAFKVERSLSSFIATKNDIILTQPKSVYSINNLDNISEYYYLFFKVTNKHQQDLFNSLFNIKEMVHFKSAVDDRQLNNIYYLNSATKMNHEGSYLLIREALIKLFVVMVKCLKSNESTFIINSAKSQQERLLLDVIDYIEKNIQSRLTIQTIAEHFGYSENYIYKIFTSVLKVSCKTYILEYRLALSIEYLLTTKLTIEEVADKCGFTSIYHFSSTFKKKYDCSPLNYRKLNRK